jgi:hypothetical protein
MAIQDSWTVIPWRDDLPGLVRADQLISLEIRK